MKSKWSNYLPAINILIILSFSLNSSSQVPGKTIIKGMVEDALTGNPMPYVSVFLKGTTVGTLTDSTGKYRIETDSQATTLLFSFIGYKIVSRTVKPGKEQVINVRLVLTSITLDEVVIKPEKEKYKNKGNPAVELIEKVIARKKENRPEAYSYMEYKTYDKVQFALSNVNDNFTKSKLFSKFNFIFDNIDTTKRIGNRVLPLFIRETLSTHYFRKEPEASKEVITAEKTINLDEYLNNKGAAAFLDYLYQNINIYDNEILFLTNKFLSPIANSAPLFYKYYIIDTLNVIDTKCVRLFFEPRNKSDFMFHGNLYITLDSIAAVRKIDIGINKAANIDWVQDISITQDFERYGRKSWLLSKEEISIDFGIARNSLGLYGQRTISYRDYVLNQPVSDTIFRGPLKVEQLNPDADKKGFWDSNRYVPISRPEKAIYSTIDSLREIPAFRRKMNIVMMLSAGFYNIGKVEIGPVGSFYSINEVEGSRVRFGGRTTTDFSKKITLDGYVAYGFKDRIVKYNAGITWSLTPRTIYEFPVKSLRVSYMKDVRIPGQELQFAQMDNFFLSFTRGVNDKLMLNNTFRFEFLNEFENHFSYQPGYTFTRQMPLGNISFITNNSTTGTREISYINISELSLNLRYAPNEAFYQGKQYRSPYPNNYPVIQLKIAGGAKAIDNDYDYLRLQFNISRRYYVSILGYTDISFEAGKIFGKVPYPLLFIHNANQTYSYQKNAYNLMNFLEFVSDRYIALNVDHCFNGFILNKVPLIKKFKLRELITCKILYGRVNNSNNPEYHDDLFIFPADSFGVPLTYTLDRQPYIEASVGVSNIFRLIRVDLIKRFTYLNNPNVSDLGVRVQLRLDI
jgi:Family of unknown function (DUF5686)/CarboxypepD_reg-like domain